MGASKPVYNYEKPGRGDSGWDENLVVIEVRIKGEGRGLMFRSGILGTEVPDAEVRDKLIPALMVHIQSRDSGALDVITEFLNGHAGLSPELARIASIVRETGRKVSDPASWPYE